MIVGVVKETFPHERRVALVPASAPPLAKAGHELIIEARAGEAAGFPDQQYVDKGVRVVESRREVLRVAECLIQIRSLGMNPLAGEADVLHLRAGQIVIGLCDPLAKPEEAAKLAARGVTLFALELMPRITRAQSMDVLSSMAMVTGYRAAILAAMALPKMFPMMTTAAGTLTPAKALVIGAGVAGLQAIATARRLGAVVSAYDVRAAAKEQVESLGGKFIQLEIDSTAAEGEGGYAREMDESFYKRQQEMLRRVAAQQDVVICTAAVPGKRAPVLIAAETATAMAAGSVIVDAVADRGGNCELTRADETVIEQGVTILGPTNLASEVSFHASQLFAKNTLAFLLHLTKQGKLNIDLEDEITRETLLAHDGRIVHPKLTATRSI